MMRFRRAAIVYIASMGALAAWPLFGERDAYAFCRTNTCRDTASKKCRRNANDCVDEGKPIFWRSSCVTYHVHRLGTQNLDFDSTAKVIEKTFANWSGRTCPDGKEASFNFVRGADVDLEPRDPAYTPGGANLNVVFFRDNDWPYKGIDGTLATTSVNFDKDTGEIYDADIAVNSAFNVLTLGDKKVQYDLDSILVHEAGHFVGLNHSDDPSALMFASYTPGSINRLLADDDLKGLCDVYAPNRGASCTAAPSAPPKGCCAAAPSDTADGAGAVGLLTALALCARGMRRRQGK